MEKTAYELGYLEALEKLGMIPRQDYMTKEAQGRMRGLWQATKGIFGGAGRQVNLPPSGSQGPGLLRRGWERITQGRRVTLPPQSGGAARGGAAAAPKPQAGAPQPKANPQNRAGDTLLAEQEMAAAARGSAPQQMAPVTKPFLGGHAGKVGLLGAGAAAGAYGMGKFDQFASRPDPYKMPQQYYSAIPGGSPYQ